jgi:hypothetical protein
MDKEEKIQCIFKSLLYGIVIPYLIYISYINQNKIVLLCGLSILVIHIYKDLYNPLWKYPKIIKVFGTICAYLIFIYGDNKYIKLIGILKMIGDTRKYIFHSEKYYF